MKTQIARSNPDIVNERSKSDCDSDKLKLFIGTTLFGSAQRYMYIQTMRSKLLEQIEPIDYNMFYNLDRNERYDIAFKKTIELTEFFDKHKLKNQLERSHLQASILGTEKYLFSLHNHMVRSSIELLADHEQKAFWLPKLDDYSAIFTYAQTELGHGTYVRGLETTARFDELTNEFVLNSPTVSSFKYWPGGLGVTCNHVVLMAKLILKDVDHGVHAFLVQIRSLETHEPLANLEVGDIGQKYGHNSHDNGYLAFRNYRIPRRNMLMNFVKVTKNGDFIRTGNMKLIYGSMLLMRATLSLYGASLLSGALTIAIRYSCVRRQTPSITQNGLESQIIDYQNQQYQLFSGLSTCYSIFFSSLYFRNDLNEILKHTDNLRNVSSSTLARLHAISSSTKAYSFDQCLKYAQICRLACGGHGYSTSSGLGQIIIEADAGCTYEGDNIVLHLQAARYLLKCAQKNQTPHFEVKHRDCFAKLKCYDRVQSIIEKYNKLYERMIADAAENMIRLITEQNQSQFDAWNNTSVALVETAKIYVAIYVIMTNLSFIYTYSVDFACDRNLDLLECLFEVYLLHGISDVHAQHFLKYGITSGAETKDYRHRLLSILPVIRKNAVALVDSFDWLDSSLCSTLGAYDGNAYDNLLTFARKSKFNEKDPVDQFDKYLKPFVLAQKSKL